jgi:hypothetical protein
MGMSKKEGYSVKKTIVKGIQYFLIGGITAVIEYLNGVQVSVELAVGQALLIGILGALLNFLKNCNK